VLCLGGRAGGTQNLFGALDGPNFARGDLLISNAEWGFVHGLTSTRTADEVRRCGQRTSAGESVTIDEGHRRDASWGRPTARKGRVGEGPVPRGTRPRPPTAARGNRISGHKRRRSQLMGRAARFTPREGRRFETRPPPQLEENTTSGPAGAPSKSPWPVCSMIFTAGLAQRATNSATSKVLHEASAASHRHSYGPLFVGTPHL